MSVRKFRACLVLITAASFVAVSAGCSSQPSEASSGGTPRETVLAAAKTAKQHAGVAIDLVVIGVSEAHGLPDAAQQPADVIGVVGLTMP